MIKPLEYKFNIDLHDEVSQVCCNVRKYDNCSKLIVTLSEGDKPIDLTGYGGVYFAAKKPDENDILDFCNVVNNAIVYEFNEQTAPVSGIMPCQFRIYDSDMGTDVSTLLLSTPIFHLSISDNVNIDEEGIVSSESYTALTEALAEAEDTIDSMNDLIADVESKRDNGDFDGADGADGTSCTHSWSGTTLTVTSASGTSSADLKGDTGATGPQGPRGYTPGIIATHITTGAHANTTELLFSYADGTHKYVYIPDGVKGDTGATGPQGPKGDTPTAAELAPDMYDELELEDYAFRANPLGIADNSRNNLQSGQYYFSSDRMRGGIKISEASPSQSGLDYIEFYSTDGSDARYIQSGKAVKLADAYTNPDTNAGQISIDEATAPDTLYLYHNNNGAVIGSLWCAGTTSNHYVKLQIRMLMGTTASSTDLGLSYRTIDYTATPTTYGSWVKFATASDLAGKENNANKASFVTINNKQSTTIYPCIKAMVDYVDTVIGGIENGSY